MKKTLRQRQDSQANQFAMALLMPEDWVREELSKLPHGIDLADGRGIKELAKKFKVSESLMALRLGQLLERQQQTKPKNK